MERNVNNRDAGGYVARRREFKTNTGSIYGLWNAAEDVYTVYSYGSHFPMYCYDVHSMAWYGNKDKYSNTTSHHQSCANPGGIARWFDTTMMRRIASVGFAGAVADMLEGELA